MRRATDEQMSADRRGQTIDSFAKIQQFFVAYERKSLTRISGASALVKVSLKVYRFWILKHDAAGQYGAPNSPSPHKRLNDTASHRRAE